MSGKHLASRLSAHRLTLADERGLIVDAGLPDRRERHGAVDDQRQRRPLCRTADCRDMSPWISNPFLGSSNSLSRNASATLCIITVGDLLVPDFKMRMLDRNDSEQIIEYAAFRDIYHFILRAVSGDTAAATAMFERYLAGDPSKELLTISRQWVEEDRADRQIKVGRASGVRDAFNVTS
jgi:hypothetical protein